METVCIGTITRGDPRVEMIGSRDRVKPSTAGDEIRLPSSVFRVVADITLPILYLDHGRSQIVTEFLSSPAYGDWLLFVDDDTAFQSQDIEALFRVAEPNKVVGGVYWSPNRDSDDWHDIVPITFMRVPGERTSPVRDTWIYRNTPIGWTAEQRAPFPVDAIGTGFMLIHRTLLSTMVARFPSPLPTFQMDVLDGVGCGEDLVFCARAKSLGCEILAVPCPTLTHIKLVYVTPPQSTAIATYLETTDA